LVSVGDRDVAQELVAEAFARAWASWRTVSEHPAPKAWVVRTALNANISRWRRRFAVSREAAHGTGVASISRTWSCHDGTSRPGSPAPQPHHAG
jgi:DNA-directed RNA polymerase specialized sigma24 family protein